MQRFDTTTPATAAPLDAFTRYLLMAGSTPKFRCDNWVRHYETRVPGEPSREAEIELAWAQHGAELRAEASAHGFVPAGLDGDVPAGPGV